MKRQNNTAINNEPNATPDAVSSGFVQNSQPVVKTWPTDISGNYLPSNSNGQPDFTGYVEMYPDSNVYYSAQ